MSTEERKILADASADSALDAWRKAGMTVPELPPEEMARLRARGKPVNDKCSASVGDATVKELMAEIEKARR